MMIRSADRNGWTRRRLLSEAAYRCHVRCSAGARHRTLGPEVRHIRIRVWTGVTLPPEGRQSDHRASCCGPKGLGGVPRGRVRSFCVRFPAASPME